MSIVAFVNPLLLGLGNSVMPRSVMAWKNGGGPALRHEAIRNAMLIAALMASFSLAIAIGGETVMRFLYHGKEFEGQGLTLTVLALATFSGALGMPASNALATIERPRAIVAIGLVGTVFTAVLVWVLMEEWGLFGAACGLLAGSVVGDITRWVAFFMLVPRAYDPRSVMGALGDLTEVSDVSRWTVKRLGEGVHAEAFVVNSTGEAAIWRAYHSLVTKLYKPEAGLTLAKVQAQFDSLSDLHTVLDGRKINGWKISVPRPLCILKSPLALVMSSVPGRHIDSYKSKDDLPISKNMLDAARAFTAAMEGYWSSGRRHGDLALQNILFDIEAKEISIIDAGTGESCQTCNVAIKQLATASDLAHLLWSVAIDVWDLIRSPSLYMDREIFVESVLLATLGRIDSQEGRRQLLNEILSCAQQHLADKFELAWSFRGLWNGFVRRVATQRMDSIVDRVTSHLDICASEGRQYKFRTQRAIQALTS